MWVWRALANLVSWMRLWRQPDPLYVVRAPRRGSVERRAADMDDGPACDVCGVLLEDDEARTCELCGITVCQDCIVRVTVEDGIVYHCPSCADEYKRFSRPKVKSRRRLPPSARTRS